MNMANLEQQKLSDELTDEDIRRYQAVGFGYARDSQTDPEIIENGLGRVIAMFHDDSRMATERYVNTLRADIATFEKMKMETIQELGAKQTAVNKKNDKIENLKKKRTEVRSEKNDTTDVITIVLQAICLVVLFLFLYVFYASVGYAVIDEVKRASSTLLNADVFWEAFKKGRGAFARVLLIPAVVLAFGLVIDYSLRMIKGSVGRAKKLWILLLGSFIFIAFCFDAIAGYKICENMHNAAYEAKIVDVVWSFKLVFGDVNFYLVLILGFVGYLAWGLIFHMLLSNPTFNINNRIKLIDKEIDEHVSDLQGVEDEMNKIRQRLDDTNKKITDTELALNFYVNGGVKYFKSKFYGVVGAFIEGYSSYVGPYCNDRDKANEIMRKANIKKEGWMSVVEKTFTYERE